MIAIETKYLPATNYRPRRIVASTVNGQRLCISDPSYDSTEESHLFVARLLADKMKWEGKLVGGATKRGYAFVFVI